MALGILLLIVVAAVLWVIAMLDLVRATEMDPVGRIILAAALIVVAPLGYLLWLVARLGKMGVLVGVAAATLAIAIVSAISAISSPGAILHATQVQQTLTVNPPAAP